MQTVNSFFTSLQINYNQLGFFIFLTIFFAVFFVMPAKKYLKETLILIGNIFFYLKSGIASLVIIVGTAILVYAVSRLIERVYAGFEQEKDAYTPKEQILLLKKYKRKSVIFLIVAVAGIIGLFAFVKLSRFLGFSSVTTFSEFQLWRNIIVPLGISYYSLSATGYLLDVYWRKIKPEHNFLYLLMAMTYFPIIMQGPISKYPKLIEQFKHLPGFEYKRVTYGIQLIIWGLFEKLVIADRLLIFVKTIFGSIENYYGVEILVALIFSLIQMYADFSGCMDIVQGVANIMGVELEKNFNQPFFAKGSAEYWRRWHMTLGGWFKDYIYLPIYMNPYYMRTTNKIKKKYGRDIGQLFVTATISLVIWILTGLWHGTGWNYIAWGLYWYLFIVFEEATGKYWRSIGEKLKVDYSGKYFVTWQIVRTLIIALIGRLWIVAGSLRNCWLVWKHMLSEVHVWFLFDRTSIYECGLDSANFWMAIIAIGILLAVDFAHERNVKIQDYIAAQPILVRWTVYYLAVFSIIIFGIYGAEYDAANFVYGGF